MLRVEKMALMLSYLHTLNDSCLIIYQHILAHKKYLHGSITTLEISHIHIVLVQSITTYLSSITTARNVHGAPPVAIMPCGLDES